MKLSYEINQTKAVLIGTGIYETNDFIPIDPVKGNLEDLKNLFLDQDIIGLPEQNVIVLENKTHIEILEGLSDALSDKNLRTVFIYYSGHGHRTAKDRLYLTAYNSKKAFHLIKATGIEFSDFKSIIENSPGKPNSVILLDACYSGIAAQSENSLTEEEKSINGSYIITSSSNKEQSFFDSKARHTFFTDSLIETLYGGSEESNMLLSLNDVYNSLQNKLRIKHISEPQRRDNLDADVFYFAKNKKYSKEFFINKAENYFNSGDYTRSLENFIVLAEKFNDDNYSTQIEKCKNEISYSSLIMNADSLYNNKKYEQALDKYNEAKNIKSDSTLMFKISQCLNYILIKKELMEEQEREFKERKLRKQEELKRKEAEELKKKEAEELKRKEAEELRKKEIEEFKKKEADEIKRKETEELKKKEAEEQKKKEAEDTIRSRDVIRKMHLKEPDRKHSTSGKPDAGKRNRETSSEILSSATEMKNDNLNNSYPDNNAVENEHVSAGKGRKSKSLKYTAVTVAAAILLIFLYFGIIKDNGNDATVPPTEQIQKAGNVTNLNEITGKVIRHLFSGEVPDKTIIVKFDNFIYTDDKISKRQMNEQTLKETIAGYNLKLKDAGIAQKESNDSYTVNINLTNEVNENIKYSLLFSHDKNVIDLKELKLIEGSLINRINGEETGRIKESPKKITKTVKKPRIQNETGLNNQTNDNIRSNTPAPTETVKKEKKDLLKESK